MARGKVYLKYINDLNQRKAASKKRAKGLETKIREIRILCDVEAAAVIYTPFEEKPLMLPDEATAVRVFTEFKNLPEHEKTKRMVTQQEYLEAEIKKMEAKKKKIWKDLDEKELSDLMHEVLHDWELARLDGLSPEKIDQMKMIVDRIMNEIRVRFLKRDQLRAEEMEVEAARLALSSGEGSGSRDREVDEQLPVAMEVAEEPAVMVVGGVTSSDRVSFMEETSRMFEQEYMVGVPQTQEKMMAEMLRQQRQRRMMMQQQQQQQRGPAINEVAPPPPQEEERQWFTEILDPQMPPQMADLLGGYNNGGGNDAMDI